MIEKNSIKDIEKVSNLSYIFETMGGKKHLVKKIIDAFLIQVPNELNSINSAVPKSNYAAIKRSAHSMKSSISIMGIAQLKPILEEMEILAGAENGIDEIKQLYNKLNTICRQAFEEIENDKQNFI